MNQAELVKRIQVKQAMKQCVVAELTGYLLVLGENGKLLILDQEGEFVSTVTQDTQFFTFICAAHDKLLLGTDRGTLTVYHLASLQFISEVPYQMAGLVETMRINNKSGGEDSGSAMGKFRVGPPVKQVMITSNMRFLMIKYSD